MVRVQVLLSPEEKARFRRMAAQEGISLSAWLRRAGLARLAAVEHRGPFRSRRELKDFFALCDEQHGPGREPDWSEHLETIRRSRTEGESGT